MKTFKIIFTHNWPNPQKSVWQGRNTEIRSPLLGQTSPKPPSPVPNRTPGLKVPHQPQILPTFYHWLLKTPETKARQLHVRATSSPPKRARQEDWQSWPMVWLSAMLPEGQWYWHSLGHTRKNPRTKYRNQHLEEHPLQTGCLWDFLTQRLSAAVTLVIHARAPRAFSSPLKVPSCPYCFMNTVCRTTHPHIF